MSFYNILTGHYMFINGHKAIVDAINASYNKAHTGRLVRFITTNTTAICLQFWYVIHGLASLRIYIATNTSENTILDIGSQTDNKWTFGQTSIKGSKFNVSCC